MDACKTNIVLHDSTLDKRNESFALILTAINYVLCQVTMLLINQQNYKSRHWRPDGEYYKIKLSMTCRCSFPSTSVKENVEELVIRGRFIDLLIRKDEDYSKKESTACVDTFTFILRLSWK